LQSVSAYLDDTLFDEWAIKYFKKTLQNK